MKINFSFIKMIDYIFKNKNIKIVSFMKKYSNIIIMEMQKDSIWNNNEYSNLIIARIRIIKT